MDFLSQLMSNLQGHPQQQRQQRPAQQPQGGVPTGQSLTQQNINNLPANVRPLAQIYNQNPRDPRVAHMDPAAFGYAPDASAMPQSQQRTIPVGQHIPQDFMNNYDPQTRQLAQIYDQNPMDPRVAHLDPAMFGYEADDAPAMPQQQQIQWPRSNPQTGYYQAGPNSPAQNASPMAMSGQNDPLAQLRQFLGIRF